MWYFYIIIGLLVFFAFTVRVITGFGSAMILTPVLSLFLGPKNAVIISILMESVMAVVFIVKEKLNFEIRQIFSGGIVGIIVGIILFGLLPTRILGLIIGISVLTFSVIFLLNINFRTKREGLLFTVLGLISGSMGVLTGINGPPIVFGLVNQQYDATFIRRCLITYLIVIDIITLASFSISGYVTVDLVLLLIYSIPFILIAYVVGKYILTFTDPEKLKRIILFTTLFVGIIAIWKFLPWW
ncbi:hypothetical protein C5S53_17140 [Methanophagales archaeon]|jgi:uncharacterized membrane protein YfcA|nr:hypothetical protein C5S53_17140 [Methanophagales archaeon]